MPRLATLAALAYLFAASTSHAPGQVIAPPADCPTGLCPLQTQTQNQDGPPAAAATSPIVRVIAFHRPQGTRQMRSMGSGTLIDQIDGQAGLVLTNWHVITADTDEPPIESIVVYFPGGFSSQANLLATDRLWDLAALEIAPPPGPARPVDLAEDPPALGETLETVGYGDDNQPRQARGRLLEYVAPEIGQPYEILVVGTPAEDGDSGGPIFSPTGKLAGVLFGCDTKARTTCGSHCRPIRRFLARLKGRFSGRHPSRHDEKQLIQQPAGQASQPPNVTIPAPLPGPVDETPPALAPIPTKPPQPPASTAQTQAPPWKPPPDTETDPAPQITTAPPEPPPAKTSQPAPTIPAAVEDLARTAGTSILTKILIGSGILGPIPAGLAASAATWLILRRGKKRLEARLAERNTPPNAAAPDTGPRRPAATALHTILDRTANVFVDRPSPELEGEAYREATRRLMPLHGRKTMTFAHAIAQLEGTKDLVLQGARVVARQTSPSPSAWKNDPAPE